MRTLYRILAAHKEVKARRDQLQHKSHAVPRLVATRPNQVWSWDITKLRGPDPGDFFYLYVVLDIYSRCVVGWLIADRENAELATQLIRETAATAPTPRRRTGGPCPRGCHRVTSRSRSG